MTAPALAGKRALVTGGTRGIGLAIARKLAAEGALVTITGRSEDARVGDFDYQAVDFSKTDTVEEFTRFITTYAPDIVVNNAGINKIGAFETIETKTFVEILTVNLVAPFQICRAALPGMKRNRWGRIVNIASVFGKISKELRAPYSASKFGLDGMTAALAAEVATHGILANCVAPGFVDTDLTRNVLGEKGIATLTAAVPARRLATSDEIAELVVWLAGPRNTFVSGQNYAIDGGFTRV